MPSKSPFIEADDKEEKAANNAAASELKTKIEERAGDGETVEVDVDEAREELEDKSDEQRQTRNEKKRERYREMQRERDEDRSRRQQLETQLQQAQQMLELSMRQQQGQQPHREPEDPAAAEKKELAAALAENDQLYRDFGARSAQMSQTEQEAFRGRLHELQQKMLVIGGRIAIKELGLSKGPTPQELESQHTQRRMLEEHGDVMINPKTQQHAAGTMQQLLARGKPDNWDTVLEATEITRRTFGLPSKVRRPPPTESYKQKLTGMGKGGGGGGGEDGPRVVQMTPTHRQMADAAYKHIKDQNERYKRWAAGPGAKLLAKLKTG